MVNQNQGRSFISDCLGSKRRMDRSKKAGVHGRIFAEMVSLSGQIEGFSLAGFDCARATKTERADDAKRDMDRGARASEIGAASIRGIEKVTREERERSKEAIDTGDFLTLLI